MNCSPRRKRRSHWFDSLEHRLFPKIRRPTRLLLIRHAEVEERYHKIFGGTIDMNLSPRGQEQARKLAGYLHGRKMDAIYASPMKRVQQTLAPCLNSGAPAQTIMPGLREIHFGDWTGHELGEGL